MTKQPHYEESFEWLQRGRNLRSCGRPVAALDLFLRAAWLTPQSDIVRYEIHATWGQVQHLFATVQQCERDALPSGPTSSSLLELADALVRLNREEEAMVATRCAVALDPYNVEAVCYLGHRLNDRGQFEEALPVFDRAIELEPEWSFLWSYKGMVLCNMHRYAEALPVLEHAVLLDPDDVLGWTEKVSALSLLGRKEEARAAHKRENVARRASGVPQWMPRETEDEE